MSQLTKRGPIKALLLSFLTPGLGQMYNGQLKKGWLFYILGLFLLASFSFFNVFSSFIGMTICLAVLLGYLLFTMIEALLRAHRLQTVMIRNYNRWYLYVIIILVNAFLISPLFTSFVCPVKAYKLPAGSMAPTLMIGDHLIVDKNYYRKKIPERFDIVVFRYPPDPTKDFIKRVIGLPGDTIEIKENSVFLNNQPLDESSIRFDQGGRHSTRRDRSYKFDSVAVPEGKLFVLGDNRDHSYDSRYWGFVTVDALKGKALYIYWAKDKSRIGGKVQ